MPSQKNKNGILAISWNRSTKAHKNDHNHRITMFRDHSFPRNTEFWAEPQNLRISTEFLCFHVILRNSVLDSDKGTKTAYFDGVRATILYVYISPWNTWLPLGLWVFDGKNTENTRMRGKGPAWWPPGRRIDRNASPTYPVVDHSKLKPTLAPPQYVCSLTKRTDY